MGDVLEHGSDESPIRRRWLWPATVLVAVIAVAFAVLRPDGSGSPAASGSGPTPTSIPTASASTSPPEGQQPWPTEAAACGGTATLPLLSTATLHEATGLTLLVGGAGLRLVDVDTGAVRPLTGSAAGGKENAQVTELAASRVGVSALRVSCSEAVLSSGGSKVLSVNTRRRAAVAGLPGRENDLLTAPDTTWAYTYPANPLDRMLLRPVGGGRSVKLPVGFAAGAATSREFIGALTRPGEQASAHGDVVAAVSRTDLTKVRTLGRGWVVAATDAFVLTSNVFDAELQSVLTRTRADGTARKYWMPAGRMLTSAAVLSPDARYLAFQLSRPEPDPRYNAGHPFGSSDLAVLDLILGKLQLVPGVEIAPKTMAGLTFSHNDRWLVITLNEGRSTRLLLWRPGLDRPLESRARLPGKVLYSAPVLDAAVDR